MPHTITNEPALAIQQRFFEALTLAIELGRISGLGAFCHKHHLNRTKYSRIRNGNTSYKIIDIDALHAICTDFGVSPTWLILGKGKMLAEEQP